MNDKAEVPKKGEPKKKKHLIRRILLTIFICLLIFLFLIPTFISSKKANNIILAKINDSIQGQADFSDLSLSWFRGLTIKDISFSDLAGTINIYVQSVSGRPRYLSFLTGTPSFGKVIIDQPEINLEIPVDQQASTQQPKGAVEQTETTFVLPIAKMDLRVNDGNLIVADAEKGRVELSEIKFRRIGF